MPSYNDRITLCLNQIWSVYDRKLTATPVMPEGTSLFTSPRE
jgi:hypothetical protein